LIEHVIPLKNLHWINVFLVSVQLRNHADAQPVKRFKR